MDHVFMSDWLAKRVCQVRIPHVNTRMPQDWAASDHDPIAVTLDCEADVGVLTT